jgi:hypothetical protein
MSKHKEGYKEIPVPAVLGLGMPATIQNKAYARGDCRIWVSREVHGHELRWHLSISCTNRYPTWDEIKDARYALLPDECIMAMLLPPKAEYVNIHPNCFHLHEIIE